MIRYLGMAQVVMGAVVLGIDVAEDVVGHLLPSKLLRGGSLATIRDAARVAATA